MAQFALRLDDELYERLGISAQAHFRSTNSHIQFILAEYLEKEDQRRETRTRTEEVHKIEL